MALEFFKTQVLLLHSQQNMLDRLRDGFNDGYTVHCATSGSEALTTLAETPIHVIVSAQKLPGMSGLDALREAKRRSPDTVGILLAGDEAVVGDEELFQIVRGSVTPDALRSMIDNATQQVRLLALADSANDTTVNDTIANLEDTVSEHIIMETAEDGATIITDSTGRNPILSPETRNSAVGENEAANAVDIMVLTKDEQFAATIRDSSRDRHTVHFANTFAKADEAATKYAVGVAIIDAGMVGPNIEKLAVHLRTIVPRLVAIVAGRRDDGEMLMDLINRGKVYRFLLKPVSPGRVRLAVEASAKHHLEAPDTAFAIVAGETSAVAAATAKPQPEAKPQETRPAKSEPPSESMAAGQQAPKPVARPGPPVNVSPMANQLSDAFNDKDASFTETMTGIVMSVGESVAGIRDSFASKAKEAPTPATIKNPAPAAPVPTRPVPTNAGSGSVPTLGAKLLRISAVAVIVATGLAFWIFNRTDGTVAPDEQSAASPPVIEAAPTTETPTPAIRSLPAGELLDEARLARSEDRIFNPPGSNAIELYMAASAASADDVVIAQEMRAVIKQALASAESALLERRADSAIAALQRIALADPDNTRLPFLNAQLAQLQVRNSLEDARLAIRESRFEDAAVALTNARAPGANDTAEIEAVTAELDDARREQRADDLLAQAAARLNEGNLIVPSNENARYFYELVLSNDPENAAARQGMSVIASQLLLRARAEYDNDNFAAAEALLVDARKLDPTNNAIEESVTAVAAARDAVAQAALDVANRKTSAEKRSAERRAAVESAAAQRVATENKGVASSVGLNEDAARIAADQQNTVKKEALAVTVPDNAAADVQVAEPAAAELEADEPAAELEADEPAAELEADEPAAEFVLNEVPIAVSALTRRKYVAPNYPRSAQRRSISGWVDVVFVVTTDGSVTDITVRGSEPGETFVAAATKAISGWEFEPVVENAVAVPKRAAVRLLFAIE